MHQHQFGRFMCLAVFLNGISQPVAIAAPTKIVLGTRAGTSLHQWDGRTQYTLILATFESKREAENYRRQLTHCVKYSRVYVSYMNKNDRYAVVVAPIHNLARLHQICEQAQCPIYSKPETHIAARHTFFDFFLTPKSTHKSQPVHHATQQAKHTTVTYKHQTQVHDNPFAWISTPHLRHTNENAKITTHTRTTHPSLFDALWMPTAVHKPQPMHHTTQQKKHTTVVYKHQVHDNPFAWISAPHMKHTDKNTRINTRTRTTHPSLFDALWMPTAVHKPQPMHHTTQQEKHTTVVYKHQVHDNPFAWIPEPHMNHATPIKEQRSNRTTTPTRIRTMHPSIFDVFFIPTTIHNTKPVHHATQQAKHTTMVYKHQHQVQDNPFAWVPVPYWGHKSYTLQSHTKSTKQYPVTQDKDAVNNPGFRHYYKPIPYIGMTTGPVINVTGAPSTYGGWQGTAFGGVGMYFNSLFYLGGEIFGSDSAQIRNIYPVELPANARSSWTYGVNLLPGIMVNPMNLFYLRGGVAQTYFLASHDGAPGHTLGGWQVGVGAQSKIFSHFDLFKHLDVRGEYVFTDYSPDHPGKIYDLSRHHRFGNQVNVGIVYKIDD